MQPAHLPDQIGAGPKEQVIRIRQQDPHIEFLGQIALCEPFDRGLCADRHEHRCFDGSVRGVKQPRAGPRTRTLGDYFKRELRQVRL